MANNQLLASDSFVSGSLAAGWSAAFSFSRCQVVAGSPNIVEPNTLSVTAGQIWTGLTWPKDQISEITIQSLTAEAGTFTVLIVRYQSGVDSGYRVNLNNGTAALFRYDAGVSTQLGATILGLTFATGDVIALCAAGACISLYQNGKRILYFYDATYAAGSPGFLQFSSVNITHTQVSSWRGYNVIQQDGIWQKQGIVIPALAGDLPTGIQPSSSILFESNAQLLSGNVYKMWFAVGNANVGYAESSDGIIWTRRSSPVISGVTLPMVLKVGATYYLYAQTAPGGSSSFSLYTSADGINWTLQSSSILGLGGVGAWDHVFIYVFQPVAIINGTWYALYTGGNNGTTFVGSVGLATSPDGINWTKYAGNPVLASAWNSQAIAHINGTYYMWVEANQLGQGNNSAPGLDPTEIVRYQSTDLINWTNPVHSLHNTEMFESLNTTTGQCYPGAIIDVGGKAYLYTMSSPADGNPPNGNIWQIGLAVAPAPIASIVTAKEEAVSFVASDNFSSGVGSLSNNWTTPVGGHALQIIAGNLCEMGTISVVCGEAYTGVTFSNDQYSEITIQILANGQFFAPTVRNQTASVGWYGINIVGPIGSAVNSFYINKNVGGTFTQIGPSQTITLQVGDVIRLSVVGNVISAFQNGFLIQQVQDNSNTFSSGFPGLGGFTTTLVQAQVSLWAGGNAGVIPNYNPPNLYVANIVSCSPRPEANTWEVIYLYPLDAGGIGEAIVVVGPNQAIAQWPTPSSTITIPSSPGSSQQFTFPCPPIIKWGTFGIGTFGGTHGFPSYFFA